MKKATRKVRSGEENLIAIIGDEDTVTGLLLAGAGEVDSKRHKNFFVVERDTQVGEIEAIFEDFTTRPNVGIVIISQHVAELIRHKLADYVEHIPTILEIPSKVSPYDPSKDYILSRVQRLLGIE